MIPDQVITPETAGTLAGLFRERVRRTPTTCAYRFFDAMNGAWADYTWSNMASEVARWQAAMARDSLGPGDRVAIMARNSRLWVMFDQAALGLGLVTVPLYTEDRADNVSYILEDAGVKLLMIGGPPQWDRLAEKVQGIRSLKRIVSIADTDAGTDKRLLGLANWLPPQTQAVALPRIEPEALATIVYTSGTTGRAKGVMLSHRNILSNAHAGLQTIPLLEQAVFLSFLPLSHTLERTIGYYLPMMMGATVAHTRGIPELARDLQVIKPHILISVPRIFERVYSRIKDNLAGKPALSRYLFQLAVSVGWRRFQTLQGRAGWHPSSLLWPILKRLVADKITTSLGGNLRVAISGGAALSPEISRVFIGLGVPVLQGYGLTETSPVVSVNRVQDNIPASIGTPLPGVEVKIGDHDELLIRGENVMLGYWNNPEATQRVMDADGWLHSGDKARINNNHIFITGRIKDIIVLANGEKVSPTDMEMTIVADALFEQVMIIGEARPYLSALVVLNAVQWQQYVEQEAEDLEEMDGDHVEKMLLKRISSCLHAFPGYAQVHRLIQLDEPWSIENGLLTPTLKVKRDQVIEKYRDRIEQMYVGHSVTSD